VRYHDISENRGRRGAAAAAGVVIAIDSRNIVVENDGFGNNKATVFPLILPQYELLLFSFVPNKVLFCE
jgi:hypothetical protein